MNGTSTNPEILLVEYNPGDVRLIREAFRDAELDANIHVAEDGREAIDILKDEDRPSPQMVLLDLQLPRKDGFEVLEAIRDDPELKHLPVLIFSNSVDEEDIALSYRQNAKAYLAKPSSPEAYAETQVGLRGSGWIRFSCRPPNPYLHAATVESHSTS